MHRCHGPEKQKGKLTLHTIIDRFETDAEVERWVTMLDMLTFKDMPPPEEDDQPDPLATARVLDWINERLHETGKAEAYLKKLSAPEYGNWVSHEKLFSGEITTPPFSPSRLWRLSYHIFNRRGFYRTKSPFTYVTRETDVRDYYRRIPMRDAAFFLSGTTAISFNSRCILCAQSVGRER